MEKKRALYTNLTVIGLVVLLAVVGLVIAALLPERDITPTTDNPEELGITLHVEQSPVPTAVEATAAPTEEPAEPTAAPTEEPDASADTQDAAPTEAARPLAEAYLVIMVGDMVYNPIPLTGPNRYVLRQGDGEKVNIIEVTEDSIWMAESTCDNQDCIYQGTVSLENRETRVLQNMVLCLPHNVTLLMMTQEEIRRALPGWLEGQG